LLQPQRPKVRMQREQYIVDGFGLSCESALVAKRHRYRRPDYISKSDADVVQRVHRFKMWNQF
jgi:hypothetical protein